MPPLGLRSGYGRGYDDSLGQWYLGFIGLVVPHLLRLAIGPDHRFLVPGSASALNLSHQHSILRIVRNLTQRSVGALAVLHDMNMAASYADEVAFMCQGRIAAKGTPEEVLQPLVQTCLNHH